MMKQMRLTVGALNARVRNGFAALSPEARRALGRKAGRASQATGRAHRWTKEDGQAMADKRAWARWQRFKEETR